MPQFVAPMIGRGVALLTPTADGSADQVLKTNGSGVLSFATVSGGTVPVHVSDGRLTTESGVPISTSDRTAQSTLYYTPFTGNQIALYDGSAWSLHTFTERSLALSGLTSGKNYDVFLYNNAGTLTLELSAAWTNDTTRADALTTQDGVYVKSGATTRRYLGTIRTTGTTTIEDSLTKRFLWNAQNQVYRRMSKSMFSSSHTYGSSTVRQYNADATAQIEYVAGLQNGHLTYVLPTALMKSSSASIIGRIGAGENTTTAISWGSLLWEDTLRANCGIPAFFQHRVGYSYLALVEQNQSGSGTITFDFGVIQGLLAC